ncbi:hypothetical protein GDO86_004958 [Hymenochirus boettgeri]|uniref:Rab15 effector protein n=1 Tax=Hymenochirus boettgeri TaxID=247094 RepID=A0A8T2J5I5_9PIPI|nr:hypothetical protein GDO86_004958 [Hymenochirus boettgeri]
MGQKTSSLGITVQQPDKADIVCEIFSQAVVYASQKLKEYLGFDDPSGTFHPSTETLNEIFLVNFIGYCIEKGVEERIVTNKTSQQQSLLFGTDWIWTLYGSDKLVKLQIAVQTLQMSELNVNTENMKEESEAPGGTHKDKSRFKKLEEFCNQVGPDCLGLFIIYGLPGKPKDIRGVLLDSVKDTNTSPGECALGEFILNTDTFLPTRDMLDTCLSKKNGQRNIGKVYINFL